MKKIPGKIISVALMFSLFFGIVAAGCSHSTNERDSSSPVKGGTVNVALEAEPSTLDWMTTSDLLGLDVSWHIFETLFAYDKNFNIKPMLASSYTLSKDKKTYDIKLRKNVKFQNGETMKAQDVIASMQRWAKVSSIGGDTFKRIEKVEKVNDYEIKVVMNRVYTSVLENLASPRQSMVVMPASIVNQVGTKQLKDDQLVGTGPYRFVNWKRGSSIVLKKFNKYSERKENWGGFAGKKTAYINQLNFKIVTDPQVMLDGVTTGQYQYGEKIPTDLYKSIKNNKSVQPLLYSGAYDAIMINHKNKLMQDKNLLTALKYSLNKKAIADAAYGDSKFYELDGALFAKNIKKLHTSAGTKQFLDYSINKAKKYLKASSYKGQTIRLLLATDKADMKTSGQVAAEELKKVGFNIKVVSTDWATLLQRNEDPNAWELMVMGWGARYSPNELLVLQQNNYLSGWYRSTKWQSLLKQWNQTDVSTKRKELLGEMNKTVYDDIAFIKLAGKTSLDVHSDKLKNMNNLIGVKLWNVWLAK